MRLLLAILFLSSLLFSQEMQKYEGEGITFSYPLKWHVVKWKPGLILEEGNLIISPVKSVTNDTPKIIVRIMDVSKEKKEGYTVKQWLEFGIYKVVNSYYREAKKNQNKIVEKRKVSRKDIEKKLVENRKWRDKVKQGIEKDTNKTLEELKKLNKERIKERDKDITEEEKKLADERKKIREEANKKIKVISQQTTGLLNKEALNSVVEVTFKPEIVIKKEIWSILDGENLIMIVLSCSKSDEEPYKILKQILATLTLTGKK